VSRCCFLQTDPALLLSVSPNILLILLKDPNLAFCYSFSLHPTSSCSTRFNLDVDFVLSQTYSLSYSLISCDCFRFLGSVDLLLQLFVIRAIFFINYCLCFLLLSLSKFSASLNFVVSLYIIFMLQFVFLCLVRFYLSVDDDVVRAAVAVYFSVFTLNVCICYPLDIFVIYFV